MRNDVKILGCLLLLGAAAPASALNVEEVVWGFDGVVVGRFNPVSVLFHNPTDAAFNGVAKLSHEHDFGAPLLQPLYLSPRSSRWVRFYPFVSVPNRQWIISWGRSPADSMELPVPRSLTPVSVILNDRIYRRAVKGIKGFGEQLFPPTVAATDPLSQVVIDHVPDWQAGQRRALLDWLYRGGIVHLLHNELGEPPQFDHELEMLNAPLDRQRVGAGWVLRHGVSRHGFSAQSLVQAKDQTVVRSGSATDDMNIVTELEGLTRPKHAWWLIYSFSVVYLVIIGPLNFLVGRKIRNYLVSIAGLIAIVALYSVAFFHIGRRGYDEASTVHSLAYVQPVSNGQFDATLWTNMFVTAGNRYMVRHDAYHSLYSTVFNVESIDGYVTTGTESAFQVTLPLYSHREFVHRGRFAGKPLIKRIVEWSGGDRLQKLTVEVDEGFPSAPDSISVLYNGLSYPCLLADGRVVLSGDGTPLRKDSNLHMNPMMPRWYRQQGQTGDELFTNTFRGLEPTLLNRSQATAQDDLLAGLDGPDRRLQLFVYAPLDERFAITGPGLGDEVGRVLYHLHLFKPTE